MHTCLPGNLATLAASHMQSCDVHAFPSGIFGTILPPVFYVPGASITSTANASLTLSNMTIMIDYCNADLWGPAVEVIHARNQVSGLPAGLWEATVQQHAPQNSAVQPKTLQAAWLVPGTSYTVC